MNNLEVFLGVIFLFFFMSMGSKCLYLDLNTIVILLLSLQPVHTLCEQMKRQETSMDHKIPAPIICLRSSVQDRKERSESPCYSKNKKRWDVTQSGRPTTRSHQRRTRLRMVSFTHVTLLFRIGVDVPGMFPSTGSSVPQSTSKQR